MPIIVKVCGITNLPDAEVAVEAGADALGFVFHEPSPRAVSVETAAVISRALPETITRVGVFVDASDEMVKRATAECGLNLLQFHGNESPEYCLRFAVRSMKAFRVKDASSLSSIVAYGTELFLLDAYVPGALGGTGAAFSWQLAVEAKRYGRPFFLAGGLSPENVGEAIRIVRPYGVDVSSGVESKPGRKDHEKVRRFIEAARQAAAAQSKR